MAEVKNANPKNSLIDVAADLISGSGIGLDTVVDIAASALSGSKKKSGSSRKKDSKSDSLLSKLLPEKKEYPQISEKTYCAVREEFPMTIPETFTASTLTNATGLKADTIKSSVLPALVVLGLLKDGKPTSKLKAWVTDDKYEETCASIRDSVYPDSLKKLDFSTKVQQAAVLKWFMKNADVSESAAKKMVAVYLLLSIPQLKTSAAEKKTASTSKKTASSKKSASPEATVDSLKVTTKGGKHTITLKIIADEGITKKALTEKFTSAAADAFSQMK